MTITQLPMPPTGSINDGPAWDWIPLDALLSDTIDLPQTIRSIRATVAGNVVVITGGGTRTMAFAAGETRTVIASRVKSVGAGTTATGLEGAI